jgi:hypothetical protein
MKGMKATVNVAVLWWSDILRWIQSAVDFFVGCNSHCGSGQVVVLPPVVAVTGQIFSNLHR